jgi:hypothetical protein
MGHKSILFGDNSINFGRKQGKILTLHDCETKGRIAHTADAETVLDSYKDGVLSQGRKFEGENVLEDSSFVLKCSLIAC